MDQFNEEQLKELNTEISSSIVYSTSISDSKVKNAINIYLRIIEKAETAIHLMRN